jgi:hypothetical protein
LNIFPTARPAENPCIALCGMRKSGPETETYKIPKEG